MKRCPRRWRFVPGELIEAISRRAASFARKLWQSCAEPARVSRKIRPLLLLSRENEIQRYTDVSLLPRNEIAYQVDTRQKHEIVKSLEDFSYEFFITRKWDARRILTSLLKYFILILCVFAYFLNSYATFTRNSTECPCQVFFFVTRRDGTKSFCKIYIFVYIRTSL